MDSNRRLSKIKKAVLIMLSAVMVLSAVSCSNPIYGKELKSDKPYNTSPNVSETALQALVDGNSAFAFDLYQELIEEGGNIFYSPYSISLALAMTYAGANSETEQQMAETLHFILEDEDLHAAFNKLALELASRGEVTEDSDWKGFQLNIINAIWGQKDYKFLSEFLDVLAENYDAGLRLLDYINELEESRITINDWVSDQTEGRIKDLIPQGDIDTLTRLVLTNAIYFNAAWRYQFDEDDTYNDTFYLLDGNEINVPMMHQAEHFGYAEGDGYQAVELSYDTGELSMVIILPEEGNFEEFEGSLDAGLLDEMIGDIENNTQVVLTMPKFEFESEFSLKEALEAMGMPIAFSGGADFSGMTGNYDLFIRDVVHKAFVSVDEEGTEAAAASAAIAVLGMSLELTEVTINHPFIFLIRDIQTGTILFVGRVVNPAA